MSVQTEPSLQLGKPRVLFSRERDSGTQPFGWPDGFDVSADGRFLIVRPAEAPDEEGIRGLVVTQNWIAEFSSTE